MAEISDIKVLGPKDKLIVAFKGKASPARREMANEALREFIKKERSFLFVGIDCDLYIMKKGSKVLLKDELNKDLAEKK